MIDKAILDEVLPVPELETLKEEKIAELKEEGFAITNFHSGGVFYTLLLIVLRIKIEFTELLRAILNNMTLTHSTGAWLDIKAADYGKKRKKAQKAQGLVTLSRTNDQGEAVKIEKGHIFKTQKDINGEELRFFAIEAAVLQKGSRSVDVLVEAEKEGTMCRKDRSPGASRSSMGSTASQTARTGSSGKEATPRTTRGSERGRSDPGRSSRPGLLRTHSSMQRRPSRASYLHRLTVTTREGKGRST